MSAQTQSLPTEQNEGSSSIDQGEDARARTARKESA
jgi:hypothetical protein